MDTRKIRRRLFAVAGGLCEFCGIETILPDVLVARYSTVKFGNRTWTKEVEFLLRNNPEFHKLWHSVMATIEHVLPLGAGGTWARDNLKLACYRCNQSRARVFAKGLPANQKKKALLRPRRNLYWSVINDCWMVEPEQGQGIVMAEEAS